MNIKELHEILRSNQDNDQQSTPFPQDLPGQRATIEPPKVSKINAGRKKENTTKEMLDHLIRLYLSKDTKKGQQLYGNIGRQNY